MKILYSFTVFYFFTISFLYAQSNYKPGYVVNSKNDTLKGFVDYREWSKNPKEINFKQSLSAPAEKFSPANAKAFAITNAEYYERFIVKVSTSEVELNKLSSKLDTAYTVDTVFLKNLINGKNVSLYVLTNKLKSLYYILNKRTSEIDNLKQYLYYDDEHHSVSEVNIYINQLLRLAYEYQQGNRKIQVNIQKSKYSESYLSAIAILLNGGIATQQAVHSSSGIRFLAGAGVRYSKLQFNSPTEKAGPFSRGIHDNSISPVLAVGLDFLMNKYTEKLVFRLELTGAINHYQLRETVPGINAYTGSLDLKMYHISAIPQVMYNFYSADKLKAFINIGVAMNIYKYNNYSYIITYDGYGSTIQNKYPEFESFVFSIPVKAGVQINKRLELYGTYWMPNSITRYPSYSADQSAFQAGVNYIFR